MKNLHQIAALWVAVSLATALTACGGGGGGSTTPPPPTAYTLTVNSVNPATGVGMTVSPADNNGATNGNTSFTRTYNSGTAVTVTATSPTGDNTFASWAGCTTAATVTCHITISANTAITATFDSPKTTPTVTVTPASFSITTAQALSAAVSVSGGGSNPVPTGSVTLSSGTYTSSAATLSSGSATINVPAGSLAVGSDTLSAAYTPDSSSSSTYNTASGTSAAVTVAAVVSTVAVDQTSIGPAVTDQLLGMNLAAWYDIHTNATPILNAFNVAGIKAVRWPGGSWSDVYHWQSNSNCQAPPNGGGTPNSNSTFANFVSEIAIPGGLDVALTANYGSNAACTGGGDPTEASSWITKALADGITVSHMTVGNEEYGSWEEDLHAKPNDPATYAGAVVGAGGYYSLIKAASPNTLVGVDVEADNVVGGWDDTVLANAKGSYDFVEYHFYPQAPGSESDAYLVQKASQDLTKNINTIKSELTTAGKPNTPIYVGEMGSVYSSPGKQSWSITQGLYAGQALGEMMNDGVVRATWWIGFGNCDEGAGGTAAGNMSSSLYGWQTFGAYNVFSDGPTDGPCGVGSGPIGTMSPTARAFQLFSNVAVNGESVLTAGVTGDTTNVRAYAATHSGGTILVLFNVSQTAGEQVTVSLSAQNSSTDVSVETYSKAIYDQSQTNVWSDPTTTDMGAQNLPLTLMLAPWSMNVVIIK
ncbi:MAG: hypothetical protein WCA10_18000 [Terracidiphilus sp.]